MFPCLVITAPLGAAPLLTTADADGSLALERQPSTR